jgi:hypothetical protein|tara:strand:+ start:296 stop:571 length:276 start_codon:yes stop_codon:yes gene_type:complete
MSFIRNIDGVPLYTTIAEAELWASQYNLTGYHTHNILGQIGYMGGTDHATITAAMNQEPINTITPQQVRSVRINPTPTSSVSSSGSGSGGY